MTVKTGQALAGLFATRSATGALTAASVTAGALYVDGVVSIAGVTVTGANPYKWAVTLPALTAGQVVSIYITATISTIATGAVVFEDVSDTNRVSDIDIAATGEVGLDFNNIKAATAPTTLTNITVPTVTTTGTATAVTTVNGIANDVITAAAIANGAIDAATFAAGAIDAAAIANGAIDSATFALGAIDADAIAADAIGSSELAASAVDEIADQVWDELIAGHAIAGSTGATLTTAASAGGATPASLWAYATRTLTQSAAQVVDIVSGSSITAQRGDTLTAALTGIGNLTGYVTLDFTVKYDKGDADTSAIVRIRKNASGLTDGLRTILGAAAVTSANGTIAITSTPLGNVTITLAAAETAKLIPGQGYYYDIQMITATTVLTMTTGTFNVAADVTRLLV